MSGKTASRVREGKKTILAISLFVQCLCVVPLAMRHAERLICSGMCVGSSEPTIKWCGAVLPSPSTRTPTEIIAHLSGSTKSVENQNIKNMFSWKKFSNRETTDNRQGQMICAAFLWRHPFALNTHPYTIIWTKHSFIETQEQESACLQRSKTKPTSPTRLKGTFQHLCHFSNKIAGKPRFLRDVRRVFIWARCKPSDVWLVLHTLWDTDLSFKGREEMPCPSCHSYSEPNDVVEMQWGDYVSRLNRKKRK